MSGEKKSKYTKEFIDEMSSEIIKELKEKAHEDGRELTFDDIEEGVLLFRQRIGEEMTNAIVKKEGNGKLPEKKSADVADTLHTKDTKGKHS